MSSWIDWDVEDEDGDNPTGKPGMLEFRLSYSIEPGDSGILYTSNGDGYPGHPPSVAFEVVRCRQVRAEKEDPRTPTEDEQASLCDWFQRYLDARPSVVKQLEELAFEYSYIEPDNDDIVD